MSQPFTIVQRRRSGRTVFQVTDLRTGKVTTHASKREATACAKQIRAEWLRGA